MATNGTQTQQAPDFAAIDVPEAPIGSSLAPVVDKMAYSFAKGMVALVKELEQHIATETRKVGDAVDKRLETLQASFHEFSRFVEEQRTANAAVQDQLQQLKAADTSLRETATGHTADIERLGKESGEVRSLAAANAQRIDEICKELGVQQEDIAAMKGPLGNIFQRVEALVERMDRQADAVRSMNAAYAQRESELEQVMDGLTRLRAYKTAVPTSGL